METSSIPMKGYAKIGACCLWARRHFYRATPAETHGASVFAVLSERPSHLMATYGPLGTNYNTYPTQERSKNIPRVYILKIMR